MTSSDAEPRRPRQGPCDCASPSRYAARHLARPRGVPRSSPPRYLKRNGARPSGYECALPRDIHRSLSCHLRLTLILRFEGLGGYSADCEGPVTPRPDRVRLGWHAVSEEYKSPSAFTGVVVRCVRGPGIVAIVSARRRSIGQSHRAQPGFVPTELKRKNRECYRVPRHRRRGLS